MTTPLPERAGRRCHNVSPAALDELLLAGSGDGSLPTSGSRTATARTSPCVPPPWAAFLHSVMAEMFYNFRHELVARHVPAVWEKASPTDRPRGTRACRRRDLAPAPRRGRPHLQGGRRGGGKLALRAAEGCTRTARSLYAAHADLPVPDAPHLALWHGATLLREHRATVTSRRCSTRNSTRSGPRATPPPARAWLRSGHGHARLVAGALDAAVERLRERGLLDSGAS